MNPNDPHPAFRQYPPTGGQRAPQPQREARAWLQIRVMPFTPSVDPRMPPLYESAVEGIRSDGITFGVPIMLRKERIDVVPGAAQGMQLAVRAINDALKQLHTFRDCECSSGEPCQQHRKMMEGGSG